MTDFPIFIVGGTLRDKLLGLEPKDVDFLMLAPSFQAMKDCLVAEGAKIFVEKPEFLTIRCKHPKLGAADFTCGRKDGTYTDGRRPDSVEVTTDILEDLSRRDFRMNAMAQNVETGTIIDPFDGRKDIEDKMIRSVGVAEMRLREDRLRAFRAMRFAITKQFGISGSVMSAIRFLIPEDFAATSTERIREELAKALRADPRETCHLIFSELEVLGQVILQRGIWFEPKTGS